ncbi:MFS transporter [Streptomyces chryseus]|uniref:MFS transporter n=1 Tax=Streptomyces chryseus TaxID=68186 RepID=UPI00110F963E|nr:MFS transporter [Streptomyces chryseus]GGX44852.1 putative MFS-type transporter YddS [Streptomyces chryseus]
MATVASARPPAGSPPAPVPARVQRRVLRVLLCLQILFSMVIAMSGPVVSLLAERITGSATRAGFTQASIFCGSVACAVPLAALSARYGRRVGLAVGQLTGAVAAGVVVCGALLDSFPLVVIGSFGIGGAIAAGFQIRFAATDLAADGRHGRAVGMVTWASTAGGVLGPSLVGITDKLVPGSPLPEFTSPFIVIAAGLVGTSLLAYGFLRPDPLLLARAAENANAEDANAEDANAEDANTEREHADAGAAQKSATDRPAGLRAGLRTLRHNAQARRAVVVSTTVHAVMIALMNMAALHMHHGGVSVGLIGIVISVHVAGMYLPSPLVGYLVDTYGSYRLFVTGLALQFAAAGVLFASPPHSEAGVGAGLLLLGAGWAAGFVAGSAALSEALPISQRVPAQGACDLIIQAASAVGALAAGLVVAQLSYAVLAALGGAAVLAVLLRILWTGPRGRPA